MHRARRDRGSVGPVPARRSRAQVMILMVKPSSMPSMMRFFILPMSSEGPGS